MKISFEIPDMTCGHCVRALSVAIAEVDPGATVVADLPAHRIEIDGPTADADALADAIRRAGYTPALVAAGHRS